MRQLLGIMICSLTVSPAKAKNCQIEVGNLVQKEIAAAKDCVHLYDIQGGAHYNCVLQDPLGRTLKIIEFRAWDKGGCKTLKLDSASIRIRRGA